MSRANLLSLLWKATKFERPYVIGMIHLPALPGLFFNMVLPDIALSFVALKRHVSPTITPNSILSTNEFVEKVREETQIYAEAKIDGIMVENMLDIPYVQEANIGPEVTANMTLACMTVNEVLGASAKAFGRGIQILAAANRHAIAVAQACSFDFIRAECYTFAHVADEGLMSACAGDLLRYRRYIGADDVAIITDLKKKHSSHAITSDLSVGEMAKASEFFSADGVIITGSSTGFAANPADYEEIRKHTKLPVFVGSGMTTSNIRKFINADGFIVGSFFKEDGNWRNRLNAKKVQVFMQQVRAMKRDGLKA